MSIDIYKVAPITDPGDRYFLEGPGREFGYYGGTLWPELRFTDIKIAEQAARIANIAYAEGYGKAQLEIRKALGL